MLYILNGITECSIKFMIPPSRDVQICKQINILMWNVLFQLECCGVDGPNDFSRTLGISIPGSCCGKNEKDTCNQMDAFKEGCAEALKDFFHKALNILGGVALGIAAAEVRTLCKLIKKLNCKIIASLW